MLLNDPTAWLDSEPTIAAMLAADRLAGRGLDLLARIQQAHYMEGRQVARPSVLRWLAEELGLDGEAFGRELLTCMGDATRAHVEASRALLARLGRRGYPTLALARDDDWRVVDVGPYLGRLALSDLWSWDGTDWTLLPAAPLTARSDHAMAFDSARQRIVVG